MCHGRRQGAKYDANDVPRLQQCIIIIIKIFLINIIIILAQLLVRLLPLPSQSLPSRRSCVSFRTESCEK